MWQSLEILHVLLTLTLKQVFWKTKHFLKKLGYRLLVERTTTGSASFPYKTSLSKANVKANRTGYTKSTYHKERSFAKLLFFFENLMWVQKLLLNSSLDVPISQISIFTLFIRAWVLFECAFPLSILEVAFIPFKPGK